MTEAELERADRLLLLPDLLVASSHRLRGSRGGRTHPPPACSTPQPAHGQPSWSTALSLPPTLLPEVVAAGPAVGTWRGVPVHLVGSHDTASAFLGMPGGREPGTVFVSAGTWVIVGVERPAADTSPAARAANFSNEAGALGGVRFLRNVMGFWMLERCRSAWGDPTDRGTGGGGDNGRRAGARVRRRRRPLPLPCRHGERDQDPPPGSATTHPGPWSSAPCSSRSPPAPPAWSTT